MNLEHSARNIMQKRQSHKKSRRGCKNCKTRHVKCDEQTPSCANCTVRNVECEYNNSSRNSPTSSLVVPTRIKSRTSSKKSTPSSISTTSSLPPSLEIASDVRQLLELNLMRRWCTSTWKTMCSIPEDYNYFQNVLPQVCLKNRYLLDGLFALTAMDMLLTNEVTSSECSVYRRATLEYFNRGTEVFRKELDNCTPENVHLLYLYAVAAADITLLMPEFTTDNVERKSTVDRIKQFFYMLRSALSIVRMQEPAFWNSPLTMRRVVEHLIDASLDYVTEQDAQCIALLQSINDQYYQALLSGLQPLPPGIADAEIMHNLYGRVIELLQLCYAENSRNVIKGFCIAFCSGCGDIYIGLLNNEDPMALLILMGWAVLLHRLEGLFWWARSVGKGLIDEIPQLLITSPIADIPETSLLVSWAKQQVEVDPILLIEAPGMSNQMVLLDITGQA